MDLLRSAAVVSEITAAVFVPAGGGTPVHRDRPTHGLALHIDCGAVYRFDSGEVLDCRPGQLIYLPQGSSYVVTLPPADAARPDAGVWAVNFRLVSGAAEPKPFRLSVRGRDEMRVCFAKAQAAWKRRAAGDHEECLINLYRLIRLLKKEAAQYAPRDHTLAKLTPALNYIRENFARETIPLARLAELCGVSQPYLRRLFHAAFSATPSAYVRGLRIEYAKQLLRSGEYSVAGAAQLSGFNDVTYFSREFRKLTGVSPGSFCRERGGAAPRPAR